MSSTLIFDVAFGQAADGDNQNATKQSNFVVYFDSNAHDLSKASQVTLDEVAAKIRDQGATRVLVTGHADAAGEDAYNLALSMRRAQTVASALLARGVPPAVLFVDWKGEYEPSVSSLPNQPNAGNRRVVVELQFAK